MNAAASIVSVIPNNEAMQMDGPAAPVEEPTDSSKYAKYTPEFVLSLRASLLKAAAEGFTHIKSVMPARKACQIIEDAIVLFKAEPTLIEVHR